MLKACVINFKASISLILFAYDNIYHSSIQFTPYEALYERRCISPVGWFRVAETTSIGPDSVHDSMDKVQLNIKRLLTT